MAELEQDDVVQNVLKRTLELYREDDDTFASSAELLKEGLNDGKLQDTKWVSDVLCQDMKNEVTAGGTCEDKNPSD